MSGSPCTNLNFARKKDRRGILLFFFFFFVCLGLPGVWPWTPQLSILDSFMLRWKLKVNTQMWNFSHSNFSLIVWGFLRLYLNISEPLPDGRKDTQLFETAKKLTSSSSKYKRGNVSLLYVSPLFWEWLSWWAGLAVRFEPNISQG